MSTAVSPVAIPDSRLARDATELIRSIEPDLLYHHSRRVYAFGALQGERRDLSYDPEHRLLHGHAPLTDRFARLVVDYVAAGVTRPARRVE
jgi:hypothetical protein